MRGEYFVLEILDYTFEGSRGAIGGNGKGNLKRGLAEAEVRHFDGLGSLELGSGGAGFAKDGSVG